MQDIEFTVERGKLYLLQTRTGKRTAAAAVRIATEMVDEGLIDATQAVLRVRAEQLDQLLHPVIDPRRSRDADLHRAAGESRRRERHRRVRSRRRRAARARAANAVILVRDETTPEDFHGIVAARAVLTARGGMTSHAAVVARGMGKCAVVGCKDIDVDRRAPPLQRRTARRSPRATGSRSTARPGSVFAGDLPTMPSEVVQRHSRNAAARRSAPSYQSFARLLGWADEVRTLRVRANADTPRDARIARGFGAEGIGLCRTEHMFFEGDRITAMREMIVARDEGGRRRALAKLLPMQRADFEGIFEAMDGLPGHDPAARSAAARVPAARRRGEQAARAHARASPRAELTRIVESLRETNPMLGHRGCRLGITYPEITEMQGRAIFEAAVRAKRRGHRRTS